MKLNKIIGYFLILALCIVSNDFAQLSSGTSRVGTTAGQFLKIGAGARAIGMGEAFTAFGTDVYSIYYNPAGLARGTKQTEMTFNHAEWLADMSYDFAAAVFNMGDFGSLAASFTSLSVPEDLVRTEAAPEGDGRKFDAGFMAIGVAYSKNLTDRFSVGFQGKYIRESIWNSSASGFALDLGTFYVTPFNDMVIGASISNFGSTMKLDGRDNKFNTDPNDDMNSGPNQIPANYELNDYDLPLTFRIGLSMNIIKTRYFRVSGAVDALHPNDNTEYMNCGSEIAYDEMFFVRVGYKSLFKDNSEEGLTFGGGIKYAMDNGMEIMVNYGYADYGRLENVQFFDVSLGF